MKQEKLIIEGMSCMHCAMALQKELQRSGVQVNETAVGYAFIEVDEAKHDEAALKEIVAEAGYNLVKIEMLS
ncbi:MAG: heavy-metal-associated domain-containing protein [Ignavibacteria bacterium]|nr:heavy-metal-associated domain-containing protein [Ignavibacteria bacterium]